MNRFACECGRRFLVFMVAATVLGALSALANPAFAHKPSDAYLHLSATDSRVQIRWDIALRDLDMLLDLDANQDGKLSWGEVRKRQPEIDRAALNGLTLSVASGPCKPGAVEHALIRHSDGVYASLTLNAQCAASANSVQLSYRLFDAMDPSHRVIVKHANSSTVAAPDGKPVTLALTSVTATASAEQPQTAELRSMLSHIGNGIGHILEGWDHLAFLILLVLPAVLRREQGRWVAQTQASASLRAVFITITAFTLAHSLTLSASVLHWLTPPSRWVEAAIAASIVVAAVMNYLGARRTHWWPVAMIFGLVHGFGFASVLNDAGLSGWPLAAGLVGFNLGVEIGQLLFIALIWPLFWVGRNVRGWTQAAVPSLSALLAVAGGYWLIERTVL